MTKLANFWAKLIDNVITITDHCMSTGLSFPSESVQTLFNSKSAECAKKFCLGTDETSMFKGTLKIMISHQEARQLSPVSSKAL